MAKISRYTDFWVYVLGFLCIIGQGSMETSHTSTGQEQISVTAN